MTMTINKSLQHFDTQAVRRQFPGLEKGAVCLNNGSGALVYKGAIERYCQITVSRER